MTRREQLRPEVRARTIQAACAHARLTPCGDVPADAASDGHLGVVFDRSGATFLVVGRGGRPPAGRFRITCRAGVPGLGVLRLEGRAGETVCLAAHPAVAELLALHRPTWAPTADAPDQPAPDDLVVVAVDLDAVTVLTPATETCRAAVVPVDVAAYRSACPDGWLLDVEPTRESLERDHQADLRSLVLGLLQADLAATLTVSVRAISPGHLELACITFEGVTAVTIPFGDRLDHPSHVRRWVTQAARRVA